MKDLKIYERNFMSINKINAVNVINLKINKGNTEWLLTQDLKAKIWDVHMTLTEIENEHVSKI